MEMDRQRSSTQRAAAEGPDLGRIHRTAFTSVDEIVRVLSKVGASGTPFHGGLGRLLDRETAHLEAVDAESVTFSTENFDLDQRSMVALTFRHDGDLYLMSSALLDADSDSLRIRVATPPALFRVERRDRERRQGGLDGVTPSRATVRWKQVVIDDAKVVDYSGDGVALEVPATHAERLDDPIEVQFADGPDAGLVQHGLVCHRKPYAVGSDEVGLSISAAAPGPLIPIERRSQVIPRSAAAGLRNRWKVVRSGARLMAGRALSGLGLSSTRSPQPDLVRFENDRGEEIVALRDAWRPEPGAPCVVIPPAWAKTKETLLPLARTIVATFEQADVPVQVLRLDGIRRRGESHNDPENRVPGHECHHMTFSQGVHDIEATLEFLASSPDYMPSKVVLVTFSGASIEARKALADDRSGRVAGWVSVVGAADLLSGLRVVSGGQDYIGGYERGVRFGIQRVLGIETDADLVCDDALQHQLAHLEDARRQMARISAPIAWIQGEHDAWIDPDRVREVLSCGDASHRRLIEVPTGHQLRTSSEALDVFQLIASEVGRFLTGAPLAPEMPDLADLERRRLAERARLPTPEVDLKQFWSDYLLGRVEMPGMELLTGTVAYQQLMEMQAELLAMCPGHRIADLGSGIGPFPLQLAANDAVAPDVKIHEFDFLLSALQHCERRLAERPSRLEVGFLACDLSLGGGGAFIPVQDGTYDSVIASLLLNYVDEPEALLREARRMLRPGGRLVISALRRDIDISTIYVDAANEIRLKKASGLYADLSLETLESAVRSFLNEAARLVDLEEQGLFHFWSADELADLVRAAGFSDIRVRTGFGDPPQAIVVSALAAS